VDWEEAASVVVDTGGVVPVLAKEEEEERVEEKKETVRKGAGCDATWPGHCSSIESHLYQYSSSRTVQEPTRAGGRIHQPRCAQRPTGRGPEQSIFNNLGVMGDITDCLSPTFSLIIPGSGQEESRRNHVEGQMSTAGAPLLRSPRQYR